MIRNGTNGFPVKTSVTISNKSLSPLGKKNVYEEIWTAKKTILSDNDI